MAVSLRQPHPGFHYLNLWKHANDINLGLALGSGLEIKLVSFFTFKDGECLTAGETPVGMSYSVYWAPIVITADSRTSHGRPAVT